MVIQQGDIYWIDTAGTGAGLHPYVVVQNDFFNDSLINTVIVCEITSNTKKARFRGNVLLRAGEANLPRDGVVTVTQINTVDKVWLEERIGTLSRRRLDQVLSGIALVLHPDEPDPHSTS